MTKISLERIYPNNIHSDDTHSQAALALHLDRYDFASTHLKGDVVVDIACGCGYGTALMAEAHPDKQFIGVDIDPEAIDYASQYYKFPNLEYICSSAEEFSPEQLCDTIVSLETIEHLIDPRGFVETILNKLLIVGGNVIASVPVTPTIDGNPHHLHDFTENSFLTIFKKNNCEKKKSFEQVQPWFVRKTKSTAKSEPCSAGKLKARMVIKNIMFHYLKHPFYIFNRLISILRNGPCNKYLTICFVKLK